MIDRDYLFFIVNRYTIPNKEKVLDHILDNIPTLGKTVYVLYKERKECPYQIVTGKITSMRLGSKDKKTFSVEGRYQSHWNSVHYYQGSFALSAIDKKVFFDVDKAKNELERLNTKSIN